MSECPNRHMVVVSKVSVNELSRMSHGRKRRGRAYRKAVAWIWKLLQHTSEE